MRILYCIYQLFIALPVTVLITIITAIEVGVGCAFGDGHFWGYYPGRWWARIIARVFLLPVRVEGREHLEPNQSYVFVANHQGAFDIFLIYGFLGRNFKWMMKYQLNKIPFVGYACRHSHQIFVDKRGPRRSRLPMRLHAIFCRRAIAPLSYSQRVPARLRVTWALSRKVPSCWPMSSSCPSCPSLSMARSMLCPA